MSTIAPSRLNDVSVAETFLALTQSNFTILAGELGTRTPTYQNGSATTIIGPPSASARVLNERWRDALGGEWVCTAAGTPGTWMPWRSASVVADPTSRTIPTGYLIWNVTTGHIERNADRAASRPLLSKGRSERTPNPHHNRRRSKANITRDPTEPCWAPGIDAGYASIWILTLWRNMWGPRL